MSVEREIFPVIADGNGIAFELRKANQGDSPAGYNGIMALAFRDSAGNLVLPQLNNEGAIVVSGDAGTTIRDSGALLEGSQTQNVKATVVEINLTANEVYTKMSAIASSTRTALFEIEYIDDAGGTPVATSLGHFILASGQYNFKFALDVDSLSTAGGTGDQRLRLSATPLTNQLSDIYGAISANELA